MMKAKYIHMSLGCSQILSFLVKSFLMSKEIETIPSADSNKDKVERIREAGIDFIPDDARHLRMLNKGNLLSGTHSLYWTTGEGTDLEIFVRRISYKEFRKIQEIHIKERQI